MKLTYKEQLLTKEWSNKRQEILKRDCFKCTKCESRKKLQVHHKYYINGKKAWEYKNNVLITLCKICHELEHDIKSDVNIKVTKGIKVKSVNNQKGRSRKEKDLDRVNKLYNSLSKKDKLLQDKYNKLKVQ